MVTMNPDSDNEVKLRWPDGKTSSYTKVDRLTQGRPDHRQVVDGAERLLRVLRARGLADRGGCETGPERSSPVVFRLSKHVSSPGLVCVQTA
jgi:hypothetical protein